MFHEYTATMSDRRLVPAPNGDISSDEVKYHAADSLKSPVSQLVENNRR